MAIAEIAANSGFGVVESFVRVFREAYGMPPAKCRREGSHRRFDPSTRALILAQRRKERISLSASSAR
jgi:AraC family transcriptional regulator